MARNALLRGGRWLLAALLALVLLIASLTGMTWWWAGREDALQWTLERAERAAGGRLTISSAHGSLRDEVRIDRLAWRDASLALEARDLRLRIDWLQSFRLAVGLSYLTAAEIDVALPPDDGSPPKVPAAFPLPLPAQVGEARVGVLRIDRAAARDELRDLRFAYAGGPFSHEIHGLATDFLARGISGHARLDGEIGASAPFVTHAQASLQTSAPYAADIEAKLRGTLEHPRIEASVEAFGVTSQLQASLAPFAPKRLTALKANAGRIDAAMLAASLGVSAAGSVPHTTLGVQLEGEERDPGHFAGHINVVNTSPGPVDRNLLPMVRLASAFSTDLSSLVLDRLDIALGGGQLSGTARLDPHRASLDLRAAGINLRTLYSTLRETSLAGPLTMELEGARQVARGELQQEGFSLAFDASKAGERLDLRSFRAQAQGGEASGSGTVWLRRTEIGRAHV